MAHDPKDHDPRANQKERTRAAIVEAATRLLRDTGDAPSVAEAAEAAKVSRATAYRYFPTPESLHLEVVGVTPRYKPVEDLVDGLAGVDPEKDTLRVLETANAVTFADEAQMRMALKVYQDIWLGADRSGAPVREGRRMRWLARALDPARETLSDAQWRRLRAAVALTVGVEAMVVMKDVCRLDEAEAKDVLRWAAQTLLAAGLAEAAAEKPRRAAKGKGG
jgi:AcrR family transcriptional regulator